MAQVKDLTELAVDEPWREVRGQDDRLKDVKRETPENVKVFLEAR